MKIITCTVAAGLSAIWLAGCGVSGREAPSAGAPPPVQVDHEDGTDSIGVDHPERFPLVAATVRNAAPLLSVTGMVNPDISRNVPVVSLASGRVIELRTRLGDHVTKGQLLLRIQSADVSTAFSDYRKAMADQALATRQLDRANALYERGAIARKEEEVAEDAADKARADVENATERLRVLGTDPNRAPTATVDIVAPASGVVTEQNVTNAAGVRSLDNSPNLLTISDLSHVWIVCDVFENDLPAVRVGDTTDIHLTAYPDKVFTGRIGDIGAILDPTLRTAKVRIEVANPGLMRIGMFVTATFHGHSKQTRAVVPATAILHLHDREWVYVPAETNRFQRVEIHSGETLPDNLQEVVSGLRPGQQVVANALVFQNTVEQ